MISLFKYVQKNLPLQICFFRVFLFYVPYVLSFFTSLHFLRALIFIRPLRVLIFLRALCGFIFYVSFVPSLFYVTYGFIFCYFYLPYINLMPIGIFRFLNEKDDPIISASQLGGFSNDQMKFICLAQEIRTMSLQRCYNIFDAETALQ